MKGRDKKLQKKINEIGKALGAKRLRMYPGKERLINNRLKSEKIDLKISNLRKSLSGKFVFDMSRKVSEEDFERVQGILSSVLSRSK